MEKIPRSIVTVGVKPGVGKISRWAFEIDAESVRRARWVFENIYTQIAAALQFGED